MAVILDSSHVAFHLSDDVAIEAVEHLLDSESSGRATAPPRLDVDTATGFIRLMPGLLDEVMGLKVMTLVNGLGTRYLILLFDTGSGELLAGFDADELTRTRTAAITAVACRILTPSPPATLAMIGSGFEAAGHLRVFCHLFPLNQVWVFSPTRENRERFAREMTLELGVEVEPVESAEVAVAQSGTVVLATKAPQPVVDGSTFIPETVVLSIGSTRLDLRELDDTTFSRAAWVVGDSPDELLAGSADVISAIENGHLDRSRLVSLAQAKLDQGSLKPDADQDLIIFKSMGLATQDLAVANALYRRISHLGGVGVEIGDVPSLKRFSDSG